MSGRRPDASMDLLREIREQALDPGYRRATEERGGRGRRAGVMAVILLLVTGVLIGIAWRSTAARAPLDARERKDLIQRAQSAEAHQSAQQVEVARLRASVGAMKSEGSIPADNSGADVESGTVALTGPGVRILVDDGDSGEGDAVIGDTDMRRLVNGLWRAGAEAVAINGHRVGPRTAIRTAGSTITVDYVSISRPYVVEVIGSPQTLPGRLASTPGGRWMTYLRENAGVTYTVSTRNRVSLPAARASVSLASPMR